MILHLRQIFLTLASTFISISVRVAAPIPFRPPARCGRHTIRIRVGSRGTRPASSRHRIGGVPMPLKLVFFSRLSYWCDIMYAWTCAMKSIVTTTMISSEVPPK